MKKEPVPWYFIILIILAGESIFFLPYVISRIFRPTVLEVFQINNLELGLCFSVYGLIALISYIFGGPIADKYTPRKLISVALWLTALGGIFYSSFPKLEGLKILYGYWGITTVLLFWSPMIKATRLWGAQSTQLKAFGFLEGGRGIVGALIGSIGVIVFSIFMNNNLAESSFLENRVAFKYVILVSSLIVAFVGVLIWCFLKLEDNTRPDVMLDKISLDKILFVLKLKSVWLLMIIILCAYIGYKITDVFSLYAKDVMLYNSVQSAQVANSLLYSRPIIAISLALFANNNNTSVLLMTGFAISFVGGLLFALGIIQSYTTGVFIASLLVVAIGVYSLRALYFAVMETGKIPLYLTGTAVGLISIIGYTPDIFSGPLIGYLLDNYPGSEGHQYVFLILSIFSIIGFIASWKYYTIYRG